jgi:hypothetical protein
MERWQRVRLRDLLIRLGLIRPKQHAAAVPLRPDVARQMLTSLEQTQPDEIGCDEAYALLDAFADLVAQSRDAAALMPLVHKHIAMCPDCHEEFAALLRSIEATADRTLGAG